MSTSPVTAVDPTVDPTVDPGIDADADLAAELRVTIMRTARRLRAQRTSALSDPQFSVLAVLASKGPMGAGDLAGHECVQPPSMTRTLTPLVAAGFVERTPDPADRRQVRLALTEAGHAVVAETRRRRDAWLADRLAALTPAERADLGRAAALLRRMVEP